VLPAPLESNFINPEFRGAQPQSCLRKPPTGADPRDQPGGGPDAFSAADILSEIERAGASVGIITVAPELPGALDLIRHFAARGRRVSLGHSGATFDEARAGIAAGARQATHLFNRMPPMGHRDPGLVGAILTSRDVAAEVICDGVHVHAAMVQMAVHAKGADRMMAITDGVAIAGLPDGSTASLGGRRIRVRQGAAYLDDGTLAGSATTMDRVFRFLVREVGLSLGEAVQLTATTPAAQLGLPDTGVIRSGGIADLVVLDRDLNVAATYLRGETVRIS
jgi:N-acetylglucosamine-6-phosphate deacetylase